MDHHQSTHRRTYPDLGHANIQVTQTDCSEFNDNVSSF